MSDFDRAAHCRKIASLGGRAVVEKYGPEYMSELGHKGLEGLAKRFGGSKREAIDWLSARGYWELVKDHPYAKPELFNPGPLPDYPGGSI